MLTFYYGSTYFSNKVVLTKFVCVCRMVWGLIWGTSSFYESKIKKVKRGGKSVTWPNWFCRQSITVLSTPPFSMVIHNWSFQLHNPHKLSNRKHLMRNKTENIFWNKVQNWIDCWNNMFYDRSPERFVTHLLLFLLFLRTWDWKTGNAAAHKRRVQDIFRRNLIRWWPKTMISLMHQRNAQLSERGWGVGNAPPLQILAD